MNLLINCLVSETISLMVFLQEKSEDLILLFSLCRNRVEVSYREAVALRRQEELIREEEAAGQAETELRAKREAAEKEKRSKKKQVEISKH